MRFKTGRDHRRTLVALVAGLTFLALACAKDEPMGVATGDPRFASTGDELKVSGTVEIEWPGGKGHGVEPGTEKYVFAEFNAKPANDKYAARGEFFYRVYNADWTLHREIEAVITGVVIGMEDGKRKAWLTGEVVEDIKICSGSSGEGDDCGCGSGGGGGDGGGCSHDDGGGCSGDDGGCTHDDGSTHDDGGCTGGGSGGMGGGDTGGSGGGCSHDEGGCSGGGGNSACSGSGTQPGKYSRVGQTLVLKMHDGGTPSVTNDGVKNDGITWKWFKEGWECTPKIEDVPNWCHLCKKKIIGGNLRIHGLD